jgi:hypothetical protein
LDFKNPSNLRGEKDSFFLHKDRPCQLLRYKISILSVEAAGVFEVAFEVAGAGDTAAVQTTTRPLKKKMPRMLRERIRLFRIRIMMRAYPDSVQWTWGI